MNESVTSKTMVTPEQRSVIKAVLDKAYDLKAKGDLAGAIAVAEQEWPRNGWTQPIIDLWKRELAQT